MHVHARPCPRQQEGKLDPAYISAFVGLLGVAIGGLTSFATSWFIQRAQLSEKRREVERTKREALFNDFIVEASRLYGDALSHEKDEVGDMVKLYAIGAHLRLIASDTVVAAAEKTMHLIVETYLAPNRSLHEIRALAGRGELDFLVDFSRACRADLAMLKD
jgi:hypothetical protein